MAERAWSGVTDRMTLAEWLYIAYGDCDLDWEQLHPGVQMQWEIDANLVRGQVEQENRD